jgi:hypothetical protein
MVQMQFRVVSIRLMDASASCCLGLLKEAAHGARHLMVTHSVRIIVASAPFTLKRALSGVPTALGKLTRRPPSATAFVSEYPMSSPMNTYHLPISSRVSIASFRSSRT